MLKVLADFSGYFITTLAYVLLGVVMGMAAAERGMALDTFIPYAVGIVLVICVVLYPTAKLFDYYTDRGESDVH